MIVPPDDENGCFAGFLRRGELPAGELSLNRIPRPPPTQTSEAFVEENEEQGS